MRSFWVVLILGLLMLVVTPGCLGRRGNDTVEESLPPAGEDVVLTVQVEGEGEVVPAAGRYAAPRDALVDLRAVPGTGWRFEEWRGPVADRGAAETSVTMDGDRTVQAVFTPLATAPETVEGGPARVHYEAAGEGVMVSYDIWNCSGLEGTWQYESRLVMAGFGEASGSGTFIMPSKPANYPEESWVSQPFDFTFSGELNVDGQVVTITHDGKGLLVYLREGSPGAYEMTWEGSYSTTVSAAGHTIFSEGDSNSHGPEAMPVQFTVHPSCP